jgi:hypothetical protein
MLQNDFFNRTVYEKIWKSIVEPSRPQMTIWRIRFACGKPKAIEYLLPFLGNNGYANALKWYIIPALSLLLEDASVAVEENFIHSDYGKRTIMVKNLIYTCMDIHRHKIIYDLNSVNVPVAVAARSKA